MILTTLAEYAKQKGITRARAYQLKDRLTLIDLPVFAIAKDGTQIPLYKDNQPVTQTYVQQDKQEVVLERSALRMSLNLTDDIASTKRIKARLQVIENILK